MKNYYSNIRFDILSLVPNREYQRILEVGGGDFLTLLELHKKYPAELWGVDIHKCNNEKIKFIKGSIESEVIKNTIPNNFFDLILANDVIEHLRYTEDFFIFAENKIKKNGFLLVSVPNIRQIRVFYQIFLKGTFPRNESGMFDRTHLRWFCKKDVIKMANDFGFNLHNYRSVGRFVPNLINTSIFAEFLALQNLFVFVKK
jgi:2-polyprenyl-3-methyl-5-hydroxy-6-metoxy-1,4-benzoquinol methylase